MGRPPSKFRDAAHPAAISVAQAAASRLFLASASLRKRSINAGQIAGYMDWQSRVWSGEATKLSRRREDLWELLAARLDPSRPIVAWEFGVAWGYATDWWTRRLSGGDLVWHGFDRFTGLPRAWREHEEGAFDAKGKPPAIADPRIQWHIGDVEDTFAAVDLSAARDAQWLILFDLDLYEPTAFAWKRLAEFVRPGDLMYLDEAMDDDERRVLDELILPSTTCERIGTTPLALGLAITAAARDVK